MPGDHLDRRRFLGLCGSGLLAVVAGCAAPTTMNDEPTDRAAETATVRPTRTPQPSPASTSPYTRVYREAIDSVVMVEAGGSQGTGFVFDAGHIVTNAHVIGSASTATVRFTGGEWRTGRIAGTDPHSDLAAISVNNVPTSARPLAFSQTDPVIGQEVVAIGNPFNLDGSVTAGIISGVDRSIPAPTGFSIPDAIQTDAAVNPGNSGGPLMSLDTEVVAVINSGGAENIGFGISAALTQRVVPELIETGDYRHSFMGITLTDVTPTIAAANDLETARGLIVVDVLDDGPAAGVLQPSEVRFMGGEQVPVGGDVMLAMDGTELVTSEDLGSYLALHTRPGDTVELVVIRAGARQQVEFELGDRPENGVG
jgi:S1-C subfamily serine protease